jgi:hypothetical protein
VWTSFPDFTVTVPYLPDLSLQCPPYLVMLNPISGYGYGGYNYGNWGDYTHPGYSTQPQEPALRCKFPLRKYQIKLEM